MFQLAIYGQNSTKIQQQFPINIVLRALKYNNTNQCLGVFKITQEFVVNEYESLLSLVFKLETSKIGSIQHLKLKQQNTLPSFHTAKINGFVGLNTI